MTANCRKIIPSYFTGAGRQILFLALTLCTPLLLSCGKALRAQSQERTVRVDLPAQSSEATQEQQRGKTRENLPEELKAIERDVNTTWQQLHVEARAYLLRGGEAYRDINRKIKDTPLGSTYASELKRRREHWRLVANSMDFQRKILETIDAFLDSSDIGRPQMPVKDLDYLQEEVPGFDMAYKLREEMWAETPRDPYYNAINREFKEYDRKIKQLRSELIWREPDRRQYWTQIGEMMGLESFRRLLTLIRKCYVPMARAAKGAIEYVERNGLVTH